MPEFIADFFRQLAEDQPRWNFIFFYEPVEIQRVLSGIGVTLKLSIICLILSVVIGILGAWLQGSPIKWLRNLVQGYIQFFRNTPPVVQLLFFLFCSGAIYAYVFTGWLA